MAEWPLEHGMRGAWAPPLKNYIDDSVDGVAVDVAGKADQVDLDATNAEVAGKQDALNVGSNGDQQTTVGGVITNVKPGRIDLRARGGVGDGTTNNTTLLDSLLTEAATLGAELWIPDGVYRGNGSLPSNTRIAGRGTLRAVTGSAATKNAVLQAAPSRTNIKIIGIGIHGNGEVCGVTFEDGSSDLLVEGCLISNTGTVFTFGDGVRYLLTNGLDIINNQFQDVATAAFGYSPQRLRIMDNRAIRVSTNAIGLVSSGMSYVGRGVVISGNIGTEVKRMGFETFSENGGYLDGAIISSNDFSLDNTPAVDAFAYSITSVENGMVTNNVARCGTTMTDYGFELGARPLTAMGNVAIGFKTGYVINSASYMVLKGNRAIDCWVGIDSISGGTVQVGHVIDGNIILGFRDTGINVYGQSGLVSGGHTIRDNTIDRNKAWTGDSSRQWTGIKIIEQLLPSDILDNTIIWGQTSPDNALIGVNMQFIAPTANKMVKSRAAGNKFLKRNTNANAYLMNTNGSSADTEMQTLTNNTRTNSTGTTVDDNTFNNGPWTS